MNVLCGIASCPALQLSKREREPEIWFSLLALTLVVQRQALPGGPSGYIPSAKFQAREGCSDQDSYLLLVQRDQQFAGLCEFGKRVVSHCFLLATSRAPISIPYMARPPRPGKKKPRDVWGHRGFWKKSADRTPLCSCCVWQHYIGLQTTAKSAWASSREM